MIGFWIEKVVIEIESMCFLCFIKSLRNCIEFVVFRFIVGPEDVVLWYITLTHDVVDQNNILFWQHSFLTTRRRNYILEF